MLSGGIIITLGRSEETLKVRCEGDVDSLAFQAGIMALIIIKQAVRDDTLNQASINPPIPNTSNI